VGTDFEQAGALVSAGLAAAEIERTSLPAGSEGTGGGNCANCGNALTGRYCQACGQAAHLHRSLLHLLEEFMHNVLHFDAKGWRTLPLLAVRPGLLTRRYIDGQRTRYISPLALFLFTGFLMFFVVSLTLDHSPTVVMDPIALGKANAEMVAESEEAKGKVERAATALAEARGSGRDTSEAQAELSEAQTDERLAAAAQRMFETTTTATAGAATGGADLLQRLAALKIDTGHPAIDTAIRRVQRNPELFFYRLENTASKFLFMLIPISLPFLWLMFVFRPGIAMYDHVVFSLYSLSFMSLLLTVGALLGRFGAPSLAAQLIIGVPPIHMFLQLRGAYRLGAFAALWRTLALLAIAGTAFTLFLVFVILVSIR
jgi:Protein of unknown function (DUF3667)